MAKNGNIIKGSGRSIPGFDLYQFFAGFGDFVTFGGHPMAVGVAIQEEKLPLLEEYIDHKIQETHVVYQEPEETAIHITADEVNFDNLSDLVRLDPLPLELSSLSFAVDQPEILEVRDTAKTVKYRIANAFGGFDAMLYKNKNIPIVDHPSRMIGKLELHRWNDKITCQMVIKDMQ
jgi:single-stranded-DNA-specific exonuclease